MLCPDPSVQQTNKIQTIVYHRLVVADWPVPVCNGLSMKCIRDARIFRTPYTYTPDVGDLWEISNNANKWWAYQMSLCGTCGRCFGNRSVPKFPFFSIKQNKLAPYSLWQFQISSTYIASCKAFVHLIRSASLFTYKVNAVDWLLRTKINWNLNRASRPTRVVRVCRMDDSTR